MANEKPPRPDGSTEGKASGESTDGDDADAAAAAASDGVNDGDANDGQDDNDDHATTSVATQAHVEQGSGRKEGSEAIPQTSTTTRNHDADHGGAGSESADNKSIENAEDVDNEENDDDNRGDDSSNRPTGENAKGSTRTLLGGEGISSSAAVTIAPVTATGATTTSHTAAAAAADTVRPRSLNDTELKDSASLPSSAEPADHIKQIGSRNAHRYASKADGNTRSTAPSTRGQDERDSKDVASMQPLHPPSPPRPQTASQTTVPTQPNVAARETARTDRASHTISSTAVATRTAGSTISSASKSDPPRSDPSSATTQPSRAKGKGQPSPAWNLPPVRKKKRKSRPANFPKRPLSAYNIFFQQTRERILRSKQQGSDDDGAAEAIKAEGGSMAKEIGRRWKALGDEDKKPLEEQAKLDLLRYRDEIATYEATMVKKSRTTQQALTKVKKGGSAGGYSTAESDATSVLTSKSADRPQLGSQLVQHDRQSSQQQHGKPQSQQQDRKQPSHESVAGSATSRTPVSLGASTDSKPSRSLRVVDKGPGTDGTHQPTSKAHAGSRRPFSVSSLHTFLSDGAGRAHRAGTPSTNSILGAPATTPNDGTSKPASLSGPIPSMAPLHQLQQISHNQPFPQAQPPSMLSNATSLLTNLGAGSTNLATSAHPTGSLAEMNSDPTLLANNIARTIILQQRQQQQRQQQLMMAELAIASNQARSQDAYQGNETPGLSLAQHLGRSAINSAASTASSRSSEEARAARNNPASNQQLRSMIGQVGFETGAVSGLPSSTQTSLNPPPQQDAPHDQISSLEILRQMQLQREIEQQRLAAGGLDALRNLNPDGSRYATLGASLTSDSFNPRLLALQQQQVIQRAQLAPSNADGRSEPQAATLRSPGPLDLGSMLVNQQLGTGQLGMNQFAGAGDALQQASSDNALDLSSAIFPAGSANNDAILQGLLLLQQQRQSSAVGGVNTPSLTNPTLTTMQHLFGTQHLQQQQQQQQQQQLDLFLLQQRQQQQQLLQLQLQHQNLRQGNTLGVPRAPEPTGAAATTFAQTLGHSNSTGNDDGDDTSNSVEK